MSSAKTGLMAGAPCPQVKLSSLNDVIFITFSPSFFYHVTTHSGAEGTLGGVKSPEQVSYLSESVSMSPFGICKSLNISPRSE